MQDALWRAAVRLRHLRPRLQAEGQPAGARGKEGRERGRDRELSGRLFAKYGAKFM